MLRKTLWLVFSVLPVLAYAGFYVMRDHPVWLLWGWLRTIGIPALIVEGLRDNWYFGFIGLVALHYAFFCIHPFVNRSVNGWKRKCAWAGFNLVFYPGAPPVYALCGVGDANPDPPESE